MQAGNSDRILCIHVTALQRESITCLQLLRVPDTVSCVLGRLHREIIMYVGERQAGLQDSLYPAG